MNINKLRAQLALHEGSRLAAYLDSVGILTIGIGHNCQSKPVAGVSKVGDRITEEQQAELFEADISDVVAEMERLWPWWSSLDDVRQNVLADMCFNMGAPTLSKFVNTLLAVEEGRYADAAAGMLKSLWAKQVGARALRLAVMMETGKWPADVPGMA